VLRTTRAVVGRGAGRGGKPQTLGRHESVCIPFDPHIPSNALSFDRSSVLEFDDAFGIVISLLISLVHIRGIAATQRLVILSTEIVRYIHLIEFASAFTHCIYIKKKMYTRTKHQTAACHTKHSVLSTAIEHTSYENTHRSLHSSFFAFDALLVGLVRGNHTSFRLDAVLMTAVPIHAFFTFNGIYSRFRGTIDRLVPTNPIVQFPCRDAYSL
jgi:hypothetical protein